MQSAHLKSAAQTSAFKRKILQKFDVPGSDSEGVVAVSELPPNETTGRHTHPGPEAAYVLQGSGTLLVDRQPPLQLKVGESYKLAPSVVHELQSGADGIKAVVSWAVTKGKPFASPAD